tara:strand:+ start:62 stop:253 length:192 start_codon:yes stop_codon:yes gene_type:complete
MEKVKDVSSNKMLIPILKLSELINSMKIEISERSRFKITSAYGIKNNLVDASFLYDVQGVKNI